MKKLIIACFLIILCSTVRAETKDVDGWTKSKWGMTEAEVLEVFAGQALRMEKPDHYQGAIVSVYIDDIAIEREHFKVSFVFDSKELKLITVLLKSKAPFNPAEIHFTSIEQMLTEKYGPPSFRNDKREPRKRISRNLFMEGSDFLERAWNFPSTVIELKYFNERNVGNNDLNIIYRQASKNIRDNL